MNEWFQNLFSAANPDAPLSRPAVWAGLVCLAWAGGIVVWCAVRLRRRMAAKRSFAQRALEAGFNRSEAQVLWALGRHAENGRREAVLESAEAFDFCVRGAEQSAGDDPVGWPEYLSGSATAALRRKFSRPRTERARHHIAGTREMEVNQLVNVRLGDRPAFKCFLLEVSGKGLTLSLPEEIKNAATAPGDKPGAAGQRALFSFWRAHDARYECASAGAFEVLPEGRRLVVAHAALNRVQEREHVRVRCRQEVRLGAAGDFESSKMSAAESRKAAVTPFVAMLRDISNGGASFATDQRFAPGSRLYLRLKLAPKRAALTIPARLLRQSLLEGTSNPLWASSVQFEPLSGQAEQQLSRFIAGLQQRLISRLLSRMGAEEAAEPEAGAPAAGGAGQEERLASTAAARTRSFPSRTAVPEAAAEGEFARRGA